MGFTINNDVLEKYTEENGVTEVIIPDGIKIIGERAFENCRNIEKVIIPDGVTEIRKFAFYWCSSLMDISIPKSVETIEDEAFYNTLWLWKNLKENSLLIVNGLLVTSNAEGDAVIPQGVRSIANYAFYGCSRLTSITIPESVESIGKEAFKFCTNLSSITLVSGKDSLTVNSTFGIVNKNGELNMNTRNLLDFLKVDLQEKEHIFNETENFGCKVMFAIFLAFNYKNSTAENFLKTNTFGVIKYLTEIEDCEDIKKILALDSVSHDEINQLIDYASDNKKVKAKIILSSYRNDNFNISNGFDSLFLD